MDSRQLTHLGARSPEHDALGRAIREARARRGFSQERLADEAGMHRNQIGAIERGESNPTFWSVLNVVAGLGLAMSVVVELYERHLGEVRT
jgi:transcriptional regulator with XRE-family HTH domain